MCFKGSIWYYFLFKWKQRSRSTVALLTPFPLSSLNLWQPRNPSFISSALPFILTVSLVTSQLISKDCNTGFQMLQCWSYVSIFFFKGMMQRKCWVWQCPPPFLVTWLQIRKWGGGNLSTLLSSDSGKLPIFFERGFISTTSPIKRLCLSKMCVFTGYTYISYK